MSEVNFSELRDELLKIDAALTELEQLRAAQQWHPIETAPRDGSWINAARYDQKQPTRVRWENGKRKQGWHDGHSFCYGSFDVWIAIQTPPAKEDK